MPACVCCPQGTRYDVEAWVKTQAWTDAMTICIKTNGTANFSTTPALVGSSWTKISGVLTPTWTGSLTVGPT